MEENKKQINTQGDLKTIRTYMSDMADTVRANEISVMKVALAEQDKRAKEDIYRKMEGSPVKKIFWIVGGVLLIAIAIYGSYLLLKQKAAKDAPVTIVKEESIISYDETSTINLNDTDNLTEKLNLIKKESSQSNKNDSIKSISLMKNNNGSLGKISTSNVFSLLNFSAPASLIRSFSDLYMIGTYVKTVGDKPSLFMIFKSTNYEYTYAGMLDWEKTMASDLFDLFEPETSQNKLQLNKIQWKDIIINNRDARVLINENNKPILYYIFTDKSNLIITDNIEAIKEIVSRLIIKNIKPL